MALDASKVMVGVTGAIYVGPTTATAPTTQTGALTGFTDLGYSNEDGVTEKLERGTEKIKGWQYGATVREVVSESSLGFEFTLIETKKEVVELYYGATFDAQGNLVVNPGSNGGRKSMVIDVVDGSNIIRNYVPLAEIAEVKEVAYKGKEAVAYGMTVSCYPASSLNGGTVKKFYGAAFIA